MCCSFISFWSKKVKVFVICELVDSCEDIYAEGSCKRFDRVVDGLLRVCNEGYIFDVVLLVDSDANCNESIGG